MLQSRSLGTGISSLILWAWASRGGGHRVFRCCCLSDRNLVQEIPNFNCWGACYNVTVAVVLHSQSEGCVCFCMTCIGTTALNFDPHIVCLWLWPICRVCGGDRYAIVPSHWARFSEPRISRNVGIATLRLPLLFDVHSVRDCTVIARTVSS